MSLQREDELKNLADLAADLSGCDTSVICTTDRGVLKVQIAYGIAPDALAVLPQGNSYCETVRATSLPKIVADIAQDLEFQTNPRLCLFDRSMRFYAGVPVLDRDGRVLAVLAVLDHAPRPSFAAPDSPEAAALLARLEKLANLAATILEIASQRDHSRTELAEAALQQDILSALIHQSSLPGTLETILRRIMDVTKAVYAQVWEVQDDAWVATQLAFVVRDQADEAALAMLRTNVALPIEDLAVSDRLLASGPLICRVLEPRASANKRAAVIVERGITSLIVSSLLDSPRRFLMVLGMRQMSQDLAVHVAQIERISRAVQPVLSSKLASDQIQLLGSALAETQDGAVLFKASYPAGTYRITYINRAFTRMTLHEPREILGASPVVLRSLETDRGEFERLEHSIKSRQASTTVLKLRRRDGSLFWGEVKLVPLPEFDALGEYFLAVLQDVTQRLADSEAQAERERELRATAEALRLRTEQLSRTQHIAKLGTWRWAPDQPTVELSESVFEMLGEPPQDFEPTLQAIFDRVHEDDRTGLQERFRAWLRTAEGEAMEFRIRRPDGQIRYLWSDCFCEARPDGWVTNISGIIQDITARKDGEAMLLHAEKLRSLGQLTGGIAHDFNNLLTVISINLEMIGLLLGPNHSAGDMLRMAERATRNGASLTSNLLAFARRQPLSPVPVDVTALLQSIRALAAPSLGGRHKVNIRVDSDLPQCLVDPSGLENALLNLLVNSRDAMPNGGVIDLRASFLPSLQGRKISLKPAPYIVITVTDTGAGIPPDLQAKVFEPFFTTKPAGKGTGLGLSSVVGFVRQSGGDLELSSEPGVGTTLRMYLPALR